MRNHKFEYFNFYAICHLEIVIMLPQSCPNLASMTTRMSHISKIEKKTIRNLHYNIEYTTSYFQFFALNLFIFKNQTKYEGISFMLVLLHKMFPVVLNINYYIQLQNAVFRS